MRGTADFVVVGGGIVGLAIARELKRRDAGCRITVLEKEEALGRHSSGRNSGVLHSGIYYGEGSLKARVCAEGSRQLAAYCDEHGLPIRRIGKVIVPVREDDDSQLDVLLARARNNGARVQILDSYELKQIEPHAHSATGRALFSPDTAVIDSGAVLDHLAAELTAAGVQILRGHPLTSVSPRERRVHSNSTSIGYGHLFNTAGLHADRIAHLFGVGLRYTILPFKGIYYHLSERSGLQINRLIYPVPDLRYPFLGVHFTKKIDGQIYLGPTAVPALGRENYRGLAGIKGGEAVGIGFRLLRQYVNNKQGFRGFAHAEGRRYLKRYFAEAARVLVPDLRAEHLVLSEKAGIRAQLFDRTAAELVMDFLVESGDQSTHVLNAVSPGFTSAFTFAHLVVDQLGDNNAA
jgi:(S)-2-hydroxyglutarate dehydrogenase